MTSHLINVCAQGKLGEGARSDNVSAMRKTALRREISHHALASVPAGMTLVDVCMICLKPCISAPKAQRCHSDAYGDVRGHEVDVLGHNSLGSIVVMRQTHAEGCP